MALRVEEAEAALIQSVCSRLREHTAPELADQCEAFVRQFYHWVAWEDLAERSIGDLYGAAMAVWDFARARAPGSVKVRAYNPELAEHGWRSPNTIVEVVTDDMPFLVDSIGMELSRRGYGIQLSIHPVTDVLRDADGRLRGVFPAGAGVTGAIAESLMQFEVDRETEPERLEELVGGIGRVLRDVRAAVEDWPMMRGRMHEIASGFVSRAPPLDRSEVDEVEAFLKWVEGGNFIFLGYREYDLFREGGEDHLRAVEGSGLGVLRHGSTMVSRSFARLPPDVRAMARTSQPLILTKANSRSTVHRPLYLDYIGVKRFVRGEVGGERRFLGLYTTAAGEPSPRKIPILRNKVERVLRRAAFPPGSHDQKALAKILEGYPRDELFQITGEELFAISMGIVALGERPRVRLFVRHDPYKRFVSCLVFVPRDRYNTDNRERIASVLSDAFGATEIDWSLTLSDSMLARIHYIVRCRADGAHRDVHEVERRIAEVTRPWTGELADALRKVHGEERGNVLFRRYRGAFPVAYRADWRADAAVEDIDRVEAVAAGDGLMISVYETVEDDRTSLRCKLLSPGERILLSDVLPILENMGLRVGDERPYEIKPEDRRSTWIYDIGIVCGADVDIGTGATRAAFQDAFTRIWNGEFENDRLGALVLRAGLTGREVALLRAVLKYLRQAGTTFSDRYLEQALTGNPAVTGLLVELFSARLDPDHHDLAAADRLEAEIERAIDDIASLDQDRILRNCLAVVRATVRTNYFQRSPEGQPKAQLSFKLDPSLMPFLPLPRPRFEVFVYSPRVEGVHLRGGRVARGGIRWSDRREDFRTEVLGLLKAQMVKNAVIVPVGAKGGFVTKRPPSGGGREALLQEAANCYRLFVSGLLDLTDNIVGGKVVPPPAVVRHDDDDVYLVVAADKGTASLSDLANEVAAEHGFWLGDAFASGGSHGYDHKKMGITARGAWESVRRHFRHLGLDVQSDDFTVVGIGDMSGDVFGNGMLLSPHIKLVGAFDHNHLFLDPSPDPEVSLAERRRLFDLPASSWRDYDPGAISEGGGVFARSAKRIPLSAEVREALDVKAKALTPDELIRALLCAPVDLLWNGGVGTFVKARSERNAEVGDKANDAIRVDGAQLRCRVVGEGGNLGFTQKGRIEYALGGGRINTDAIDNAAGVNCSDHEVNLKILLDAAVAGGELTRTQRDELLAELTDAVATHVLRESHAQALALSLERRQASDLLDLHARLIDDLDRRSQLDREIEELPDEEVIRERKAANEGLTGPELSVLLAYAKIALHADLLESDLPEDQYLGSDLVDSLPAPLRERFRPRMRHHRLRREIITTDLVNAIVDFAGTTFVSRLAEETGAGPAHIARAYAVAVAVFEMRGFWRDVGALDDSVDEDAQFKMLLQGRRLLTRAARWLVRNRRPPLDIAATVSDYAAGAVTLAEALPELLSGLDADEWRVRVAEFADAGAPSALASRAAALDALFFALDLVEIVRDSEHPIRWAADIHLGLDRRLQLAWLRDRVLELPRADLWQTLARAALRDDLYMTHRALTAAVLESSSSSIEGGAAIEAWVERSPATAERYLGMLTHIRTAHGSDLTTLSVAVRELANLIPSSSPHSVGAAHARHLGQA
ncbi:MAG TPA: NAD-glutamate dehydrogenase [Solirubrobacteraceae bacterium]|nr:NAD-glutamate dehydrogenase [Solirubrobacteraceae bacterium]